MRWLKKDLWRTGIAIACMLLLLLLMAWISVVAAGAYEEASRSTEPVKVTVLATPTEDATVTALSKEKLAQEVRQLKEQNEPDLIEWLRTNASILLSTLVVVIGALIGLWRWLGDRRDEHEKRREDQRSEQEKRAEERFQSAVTGLGDDKEGSRIGAAILLRTFLRPGYEQFISRPLILRSPIYVFPEPLTHQKIQILPCRSPHSARHSLLSSGKPFHLSEVRIKEALSLSMRRASNSTMPTSGELI